jgi:hypothetical protein
MITHPIPTVVTHYSFQLTFESPNDDLWPEKFAALYTKWQAFVSSPVVLADRKFDSTITIMNNLFLVQGSRFGSKAELEASEVAILMNNHFGPINLKSRELEWVADGLAWATDLAYTVSGMVVSTYAHVTSEG